MTEQTITFGQVTRHPAMEHTKKYYEVMIIENGVHSGYSGFGSTPTIAATDARRKLRLVGRRE